MIQIDFSNPIIIAALITGSLAIIGAVSAAIIGRKKHTAEDKSQNQKTILSSDTTQIQSGRDISYTTKSDDISAKDQDKK